MYCSMCASKVAEGSSFCCSCGSVIGAAQMPHKKGSEELKELIFKINQLPDKHFGYLTELSAECAKMRLSSESGMVFDELFSRLSDLISDLEKIRKNSEALISYPENPGSLSLDNSDYFIKTDELKVELQKCRLLILEIEKIMHICEIGNLAEDFVGKFSIGLENLKMDFSKACDKLRNLRGGFGRSNYDSDFKSSSPNPATSPDVAVLDMGSSTTSFWDSATYGTKGAAKKSFWDFFKRKKSPKPETLTLPEEFVIPDISDESDNSALEIRGVNFSAVVKKRVEKDEYIPVDIIMYEKEFRSVVDAMLDSLHTEKIGSLFKIGIKNRIKVTLSSPDVGIDDCTEVQIWQGNYLEFSFAVHVPEAYAKKQILIIARVFINEIPATTLNLIVDVGSGSYQNVEPEREDIVSAFVSYASKDRARVAAIVQGIQKARPDMDVFFDVESLRSGQAWKITLKNEIDKRNIFYLCWSKASSKSKWVEFEWRYALEKKGEGMIEPIPIDPPEICPPPAELSGKHFNDRLLYLMKALEDADKNNLN